MLKGKRSLYILIPLTVVVWGIVLDRLFDSSSESAYISQVDVPNRFVEKEIDSSRVVKLSLNYKDPFISKRAVKSKTRVSKNNLNNSKSIWPNIIFHGSIGRSKSKDRTAIITVDGKKLMVNSKDKLSNDLILVELTKDFVVISMKGKRKKFVRNSTNS